MTELELEAPVVEIEGLEDDFEYKLISNDHPPKIFTVNVQYAMISEVVKVAVEQDKNSRDSVLDVTKETLGYIVRYMNQCKGKDALEIKSPLKGEVCKKGELEGLKPRWTKICGSGNEWYANFMWEISKNRKCLATLTKAADQYAIKGLLSLCIAMYATLLKFCHFDDLDRVLDPEIIDGKLSKPDARREDIMDGKEEDSKRTDAKEPSAEKSTDDSKSKK